MKDVVKYGLPWIVFILLTFVFDLIGFGLRGSLTVLLFGLLVIYYFLLDNPYQAFKKLTIIAFILWFISFQVRREYYEAVGSWLPALMAAILVFVYFQRFRVREDKHWVDYLKMIGVIAILPATYIDASRATAINFFC